MRCKGITKLGVRCKRSVIGVEYCHLHKTPKECCICYEKLHESLRCGHDAHLECIKQSLKPECPICRADMSDLFTQSDISQMNEHTRQVVEEWETQIFDNVVEETFSEYMEFIENNLDIMTQIPVCDECFDKPTVFVIRFVM